MMSVEFESKIASMLRRINTINRKIFQPDRLLTLFYCELVDGNDGLMLYSNAGHCLPIHYHAADGSCTELSVTGPVIGLMEDAKFGLTNSNLAVGDVLVLYTDGITEAYNGEEEYGEKRLMSQIHGHAKDSTKNIALSILQEVQTYSAVGSYADDKTVVIIKRVK
jgi:phosphoserine phosphatase RsbU/P